MYDSTRDLAAASPLPNDYSIGVLLIDDQPLVGAAIGRALFGEPHLAFHYCAHAAEAMAFAERVRPTVILQDLVLPDIDGLTLLKQFRANALTSQIPIVVLSNKEDPAVKSEAFALGASDYLVKLPDPIELRARIRHHSKAYLNQIQRDQAYIALRESQSRLEELNIELQRLSSIDGLTGLSNRHFLQEYLTAEWKRAKREQSSLSVVMIDIDDFKLYNDTYGHLAGDEALKKVAQTIKRTFVRPVDAVARFGGEEFMVVLPDTSLAGARYVAEKLRSSVEMLNIPHHAAASTNLTISVGVAAAVPQPGDSAAELVRAADAALYACKRNGRNRVTAASGWSSL
jgi:two-component system chemotaxis family response regulator WspR